MSQKLSSKESWVDRGGEFMAGKAELRECMKPYMIETPTPPGTNSPREMPARTLKTASQNLQRGLIHLCTLLPFALLVAVVARYGVNVPYWDQWELLPLLQKSFAGTLTLSDLWQQHNEHRIFFPRLIMLALAHLTHWNIRAELVVNVLLGLGIFFAAFTLVRRTFCDTSSPSWWQPMLALLLFSLGQYENWMSGWQITILLSIMCVVTGVLVLTTRPFRLLHLILALALGFIATFSLANGIFYWPIGLLVLAVTLRDQRVSKGAFWSQLAIWMVCMGITAGAYMYHYQKPTQHPSLLTVLSAPIHFADYILTYLGSPVLGYLADVGQHLAGFEKLSVLCSVAGLLGLVIAVFGSWRLITTRSLTPVAMLPYGALAAYVLCSALITGVARLGFGSVQALAPRYISITNLLWVAVLVIIYTLAQRDPAVAVRRTARVALALLLCCAALWTVDGMHYIRGRSNMLRTAQTDLLVQGVQPGQTYNLYPISERLAHDVPILKALGLSLFRP